MLFNYAMQCGWWPLMELWLCGVVVGLMTGGMFAMWLFDTMILDRQLQKTCGINVADATGGEIIEPPPCTTND